MLMDEMTMVVVVEVNVNVYVNVNEGNYVNYVALMILNDSKIVSHLVDNHVSFEDH